LGTVYHEPEGVETVNLCSGEVLTINRIIEILSEVSGKRIEVDYQDGSQDDEVICYGDNTKCREQFNWTPRIEIKEGLKLTYEWLKGVH